MLKFGFCKSLLNSIFPSSVKIFWYNCLLLTDLGNGTSLVTSEYVYMNKNGKKEVVREQYLEADQNKIKSYNQNSF